MEKDFSLVRSSFINQINTQKFSNLLLSRSDEEMKANETFLNLINETKIMINQNFYLNARQYYAQLSDSELFKIFTKMPKGGLLHHHILIHSDWEYLASLCLNEENIYINLEERLITFNFNKEQVLSEWIRIKDNKDQITPEVFKDLFVFSEEDNKRSDFWTMFEKKIRNTKCLISNSKYFKSYIVKLFNDCIDEGILIYQGRHIFGILAEYGNPDIVLTAQQEAEIILEALEEVKKREPLFEANLIYSSFRNLPIESIVKELEQCLNLKKQNKRFDKLIIGFDLVSDESKTPASVFSETLYRFKLKAELDNPEISFNYYLHAGESISQTSENLYDSILLGTCRIGHGTNLINQLQLLEEVKKRDICIECNPLSNQILTFIPDLRDHPLRKFYDAGVKVTISSDDDGIFGTSSLLTYDFLIAALALNFDLFDLKQIIMNSVEYSGLSKENIELIRNEVIQRWKLFVNTLCEKI